MLQVRVLPEQQPQRTARLGDAVVGSGRKSRMSETNGFSVPGVKSPVVEWKARGRDASARLAARLRRLGLRRGANTLKHQAGYTLVAD